MGHGGVEEEAREEGIWAEALAGLAQVVAGLEAQLDAARRAAEEREATWQVSSRVRVCVSDM